MSGITRPGDPPAARALGAAALAVGMLTLSGHTVPPTVGFWEPDPSCAVNVSGGAQSVGGSTFLVNAVASGGTNYSLVARAGA